MPARLAYPSTLAQAVAVVRDAAYPPQASPCRGPRLPSTLRRPLPQRLELPCADRRDVESPGGRLRELPHGPTAPGRPITTADDRATSERCQQRRERAREGGRRIGERIRAVALDDETDTDSLHALAPVKPEHALAPLKTEHRLALTAMRNPSVTSHGVERVP